MDGAHGRTKSVKKEYTAVTEAQIGPRLSKADSEANWPVDAVERQSQVPFWLIVARSGAYHVKVLTRTLESMHRVAPIYRAFVYCLDCGEIGHRGREHVRVLVLLAQRPRHGGNRNQQQCRHDRGGKVPQNVVKWIGQQQKYAAEPQRHQRQGSEGPLRECA